MTSSSSAAAAAAAASYSPHHLHITVANPASSTIATKTHSHNNQPSPRPQHPGSVVFPHGSGGGGGGGGSSGSGGGGTNQACAACKYQRRKCNPDCPLAPYFPADQQRRFLNAHRLFGVSNILKTLRRLNPDMCGEAMQSLIYQSEMRAMDPVGGCWRHIVDLERQIEIGMAELSALLHHLSLYRQAAAGVNALPVGDGMVDGPCADLEVTSNQQPVLLGADQQEAVDTLYVDANADAGILNSGDHHEQNGSPQDQGGQHQQQQLYDYFYHEMSANSGEPSSKTGVDINVDIMQHLDYDAEDQQHNAAEEMTPPIISPSPDVLGQQLEVDYQIDHKEYDMKVSSLVDLFDARMELQAIDVNADMGVKQELQGEDAENNGAVGEGEPMSESSHCRLGLCFSSF